MESSSLSVAATIDDDGGGHFYDSTTTGTAQVFLSQLCLFAMTLGLSATVEFHHIRRQCTTRRGVYGIACGVLLQYTVMPLAGLCTVAALHRVCPPDAFTAAMGISVLVLCCSPGGSYSTWWVAQCNADLALSVTMTTASSILGLAVLPFNLLVTTHLAYYHHHHDDDDDVNSGDGGGGGNVLALLDFTTLLSSLALVITAIALGMTLAFLMDQRRASQQHDATPSSSSCGNFHDWMARLGNTSGLCLVILGLVMGNHDNDDDDGNPSSSSSSSLFAQPWPLYVAVVLPFVMGITLPHWFGRRWMGLSKPETVAVAIECCYQNK
eukprot:scaffold39829_cov206-Amphora_coffeaeformis.AAC.3